MKNLRYVMAGDMDLNLFTWTREPKACVIEDGRIECSQDGQNWSQMRVCHMYEAQDKIRFGIYACSPEESSFRAVFTDMQLTECAWHAHDGQQPDEE